MNRINAQKDNLCVKKNILIKRKFLLILSDFKEAKSSGKPLIKRIDNTVTSSEMNR